MSLCFILTNKFVDRARLLNKIQEFIITYKPRFRLGFSKRDEIDDTPEIDFLENIENIFENIEEVGEESFDQEESDEMN